MAENTQVKQSPTVQGTPTVKQTVPPTVTGSGTQVPTTPTPTPAQTPTPTLEPQPFGNALRTRDNAIQSATPEQVERTLQQNPNANTTFVNASQAQYNPNANRVLVNYELTPQQAQQLITNQGGQLSMNGNAMATMSQGNNSVRMKPNETAIQMRPDGGANVQVAYEVTDRAAFLRSAGIRLENNSTRTVPGTTPTPGGETPPPAATQTGNTITNRTVLEANYNGTDRTVTLSGSHSNSETNPNRNTTVSGNIVLNTNRPVDSTNAARNAQGYNFGLVVVSNNPAQTQNNGQQQNNQLQNNNGAKPPVQQPVVRPGM